MAAIDSSRVAGLPMQLARIWAIAGAVGTLSFVLGQTLSVAKSYSLVLVAVCWLGVPLGTLVVLGRAGQPVSLPHGAGLVFAWSVAASGFVLTIRGPETLIAVPVAILVAGALIGLANRLVLQPAQVHRILPSLAFGVSWGALFIFAAIVWFYGVYATLAFARGLDTASAPLATTVGGLVAGGLGWTGSRFLVAKS